MRVVEIGYCVRSPAIHTAIRLRSHWTRPISQRADYWSLVTQSARGGDHRRRSASPGHHCVSIRTWSRVACAVRTCGNNKDDALSSNVPSSGGHHDTPDDCKIRKYHTIRRTSDPKVGYANRVDFISVAVKPCFIANAKRLIVSSAAGPSRCAPSIRSDFLSMRIL